MKRIQFYLSQDIIEVPNSGYEHPVGKLYDIYLYFVHSQSFDEAKESWMKRKQRINLSNLYLVMTENDGCDFSVMKDFDALPLKNKVVFTHKPYPEIKSAYYIHGFEKYNEIGNIIDYSNSIGKRYYDEFNWVKWLNN